MAEVIRVEGLAKKYGQLLALDGVSFSVQEGKVPGVRVMRSQLSCRSDCY
jgi:ABC-type multidrug transport system ATPase subunit